MVGGTDHGADTVVAGRETAGDGGLELAVAVTGIVDTLEEDELRGVGGVVRVQGVAEILDGNVGVTDDLAGAVEILGRGVVGGVRVGEGAGREVAHLDGDVELLVGLDVLVVLGVLEDGRHHVVLRGDLAHGDTVARTLLDLLAVRQGTALAEVDEVVVVAGYLVSIKQPPIPGVGNLRLGSSLALLGVGLSGRSTGGLDDVLV